MKFDIVIPEVLGYYPGYLTRDECYSLKSVMDQRRISPNRTEHLGSITYGYRIMDLDVKNVVNPIRERVRKTCEDFMGKGQIYVNYTDLVYRDDGVDMGWHNDVDWYPERAVTGILALNDRMMVTDGSSLVRFGGRETVFPHEIGRLLLFPSAVEHKVLPPFGPRYVMLFWFTYDQNKSET